MPPDRIELYGSHHVFDSCKMYADLGKPLGALKALGNFVLNEEIAKNFRKYGLWGFRFRAIAQEGLKNIQEFIKQGGTQVEHPLILTPPTNFDANNYPLGTYLRTYLEHHVLFFPIIPQILKRYVEETSTSLQIRGEDYIVGQEVHIGVVTQAPNPKERFVVYSVGSDREILQGKYGYNSVSEPCKIGAWDHFPIQGPNISDFGVRLDIFAVIPKIEILQVGETETEKVPLGKRVFATI